jgi:hypothetical protein
MWEGPGVRRELKEGAPNRPAIEFRAMSIIQDLAKFCGEYRRCEAARGLPVGGERPADAKRVASL